MHAKLMLAFNNVVTKEEEKKKKTCKSKRTNVQSMQQRLTICRDISSSSNQIVGPKMDKLLRMYLRVR